MKSEDEEIMCALICQVASALQASDKGNSERDVTTLVTRPLWNQWLRAVGLQQNCTPSEWLGQDFTRRIYGSKTIVLESELFRSVSFVRK